MAPRLIRRASVATLLLLGSTLLVPHAAGSGVHSNASPIDNTNDDDNFFCQSRRHVHLSVGPDPATTMTVSFSSDPCDNGAGSGGGYPPPQGGVMIGTSPTSLTRLVLESRPARRYNATLDEKKGTTYWSEYQRHVEVGGLKPDTRYYYKCVTINDDMTKGWTRPEVRIDEEGDVIEVGGMVSEGAAMRKKKKGEVNEGGDEEEEDDERRRQLLSNKAREMRLGQSQRMVSKVSAAKTIAKMKDEGFEDAYDGGTHEGEPSFVTAPRRGEFNHDNKEDDDKKADINDDPFKRKIKKNKSKNEHGKVKFAIIGDVAQTKPAIDTLADLDARRSDISAVLLVGDIAYANTRHKLWDTWFDMVDMFAIFREKPLQVAAGNHEVERDKASSEIFVAYENRFLMPQIKPMEGGTYDGYVHPDKIPYPMPYEYGNSYYSFQYGPVHNIMLNSFASFDPGSKQYNWLVSELESIDRDVTPWVTVTIHCPLYNTFKWHRNEEQSILARQHLEDLFVDHRVNFVFSGHLHAYMRTGPVADGKRHKYGPIHIILGNGGRQANSPYHKDTPEKWVVVRDHTTFGYGTLEFANATHAKYEWIQTDVNVKEGRGGVNDKVKGVKDNAYIENQLFA